MINCMGRFVRDSCPALTLLTGFLNRKATNENSYRASVTNVLNLCSHLRLLIYSSVLILRWLVAVVDLFLVLRRGCPMVWDTWDTMA